MAPEPADQMGAYLAHPVVAGTSSSAQWGRIARDGQNLKEVGAMPKEVIKSQKSLGGEAVSKWQLQVGWSADRFVQVGAVDQDDPLRSGQFFTLDRHDINKLIRTLRRARDAAYGSDA